VKPWGCSIKWNKNPPVTATASVTVKVQPRTGPLAIGDQVPGFTLKGIDGEERSLAEFAGKPLVIEWFNPGCPYIRNVYEHGVVRHTLDELAKHGVGYVAINSTAQQGDRIFTPEEIATQSREWLEKCEIDVPVLLDSDGRIGKLFGAKTTPHMYVIDASGKLVYAGAFTDDSSGQKADATNYVLGAVEAMMAGEPVEPSQVKPWGCSVKYRKAEQ
jgi:peroxiredoxin